MGTKDRAGEGKEKPWGFWPGYGEGEGGLGVFPWLPLPRGILQASQKQLCSS